ncbi:hypothetical protein DCE79_09685 [Lysinibacillus sp. 2017]|uniref:DUF4085 family protein n=1 Tax=unclassified Lysinibacillus TaxID=2636778 RepID=UPI000D529C76|nr:MULTISPECIES: DUF4085 family protein [unclassified Lysinibacillus]AWE07637.1 hypothetical protein DCE79_09685 [Lysinibacillus sp. 2017]TGN36800.1 DUF4085 family protein [Lysinibacillus sp. S2017]
MKYFTKEWFELCQKTSFHLNLVEEQKAELFSEEYFQQLYNSELMDWLTLREEMETIAFNKEEATEEFHNAFIVNHVILKKKLPETILQQIADLRVFALYKATHKVINAVTKFCEENKRSVTTIGENYRRYYKEASISFDKDIVEDFRFHDCTIIKSVQNDTNLTLLLDNTGGFTDVDEVTFENFHIIKQDGLLENSWWLYEEVYKVNDNYEFHVLLENGEMELIDFIISAERVSFYR